MRMNVFGRCAAMGIVALAAGVVVGAGSAASADVMTFTGLSPSTTIGSWTEGNFHLTSDHSSGLGINIGGPFGGMVSAPTVFPVAVGSKFTFTALGNVPFRMDSIDLSMFNPSTGPQSVTFTGMFAGGGTVQQTFITPSTYGVATFNFVGFDSITQLRWTPGLTISDNLAATVPAPGAAALLAAGGLLTVSRGRRSR